MFVLVLLVRLMFLCNVNNVEPSSWTREQAAWPGGQPCQPRTENDSRGWSGGVVEWSSSSQSSPVTTPRAQPERGTVRQQQRQLRPSQDVSPSQGKPGCQLGHFNLLISTDGWIGRIL